MGKLDDKVAVVTGGGQGLGFGMRGAFAEEGAKIAITGRFQEKARRQGGGAARSGRPRCSRSPVMSNTGAPPRTWWPARWKSSGGSISW